MTQIRDAVDAAIARRCQETGGPIEFARPLTDDEWDALETQGHVRRVARGQSSIEAVRDVVLLNRRVYIGRSRAHVADGSSERFSDRRQLTAHQRAVADLFVAHVDTDPSDQFRVKSFRDERLNRRLVRNARSWVEREVRRQGAPTMENGAVSLLSMRLGDDVVHWPTRRGGVLDHLRQVSERLAHYYGWEQADAALFVITGITPHVRAIRGDVQLKFPLPARSKIVLTIDPHGDAE